MTASPCDPVRDRDFAILEIMFHARKLMQDGRLSATDAAAIVALLSGYLNGAEAPGD